ncbi:MULTISPECIES: hypothetical protein [Henriciella]|jgi:hypothetical protein|uniref:DUF481 domain-containing protein n=1 Tax=Henriciella pelagia TaxID=1977912 RepID=A0ABQ1J5V9_9PROT|nr:hypothetical protein [Henriciella pelagia]GGB58585.1 hypothetical protein GCM10011503_03730 [Henriciella pelagia]
MLRWGCLVAIACWAPAANAGPWTRHDDEFYTRLAISRSSVQSLNAVRYDTYSEYGVTDQWTATFKYERLDFDRYPEFSSDGWRATARRGFRFSPSIVVSLEGGVLRGAAIGGAAACEALGAEARAGLGQSLTYKLKKKSVPAFWFAEAAYRIHEDGCNRKRFEVGYGQEVFSNVWAISQAWFDDGTHNAGSSKYQFEYLWKAETFELSIGSLTEFGGEFEESAVFLAISRIF